MPVEMKKMAIAEMDRKKPMYQWYNPNTPVDLVISLTATA
jgi:hypothetical protein